MLPNLSGCKDPSSQYRALAPITRSTNAMPTVAISSKRLECSASPMLNIALESRPSRARPKIRIRRRSRRAAALGATKGSNVATTTSKSMTPPGELTNDHLFLVTDIVAGESAIDQMRAPYSTRKIKPNANWAALNHTSLPFARAGSVSTIASSVDSKIITTMMLFREVSPPFLDAPGSSCWYVHIRSNTHAPPAFGKIMSVSQAAAPAAAPVAMVPQAISRRVTFRLHTFSVA
jgi:hypothetical protein